MATILRMPEVLANATEAVVAAWTIEPGASFAVGQTIAEIETEKALVDLPAEQDGILGRILAQPGDATQVGAPIAVLITRGESEAEIDAALGAAGAGAVAAVLVDAAGGGIAAVPADAVRGADAAVPADVVRGADAAVPADVVRGADAAVPADAVGAAGDADAAPESAAKTRLFASPLARRRARESGIDLTTVRPSGPGGRIVRADVEAALVALVPSVPGQSAPEPSAPEASATELSAPGPSATELSAPGPSASGPSAPGPSASGPSATEPSRASGAPTVGSSASSTASDSHGGYLAIPHTGMRRAIARRLTESKTTVPHFYLTADCRVDELLDLRAAINATSRVKVSLNDLVVKAVARAFAAVPEANVTWTDTHLRQWESVDIAVAVATDGGLLTPVVRDVQSLGVGALSGRITELVERARGGRLRQDELEGGSFSVTNLGMYGVTEFAAILNPPQSGILAVGAAKPAAVVVDGELSVATVMRCILSVDHRAVDGALAARWLTAFVACIESPLSILI
ncbi:2-oxo acid dehydrogenase subunit E2 [Diaminobutyricibacter tongyongensis]|uniref:Dihydrolipoamide acetyltransferase component of pyruvate dehydrogenase complex n=1 Tax=Leifsonia tongyongensis TaxID=1268043 RepID=A0A6L9XUI5_9MICO|nr:dihydrolipoamide acetyltransferase family protein [Diaminobutyricibacter tongyongensis]NEN05060.1 2-oxo acid dehydrogenase subunit E2 [Diaminobutyricibacter tongyongensis]